MKQLVANLDQLRKKLIDLTNRNPLIKYDLCSRNLRHIDIIDQSTDDLWMVMVSGDDLKLRYLPDSKLITHEKINSAGTLSVQEIAKEYGIDPRLELSLPANQRGLEKDLQTLLLFDQFRRLVSTIHETARLADEEKGINSLYSVFGFLEWQESINSEHFITSPLLLTPIEMDPFKTASLMDGSSLCGSDVEPNDNIINPSLRLRLKHDFNLDLPEWETGDTPSSYFERIETVLNAYPKWRVIPRVLIGNFTFPKLALYEDLDVSKWGDENNNRLANHPIMRQLLGGSSRVTNYEEGNGFEEGSIGSLVEGVVFDADSSQLEAIRRVSKGETIVLEGPPGTGKSQTIANLIAVAMAQGKKVLFVADKKAAIDVVEQRLKKAGLGVFCLNLHDGGRIGKESMYSRLEERLEHSVAADRRMYPVNPERDKSLNDKLCKTADKLDSYFSRLANSPNASSPVIADILWSSIRSRHSFSEFPGTVRKIRIPNVLSLSPEQSTEINEQLLNLEQLAVELNLDFKGLPAHPLFGLRITDSSFFKKEQLVDHLATLSEIVAKLIALVDGLAEAGLPIDQTPIKLEMLLYLVETYKSDVDYLLGQALASHTNIQGLISAVELFMSCSPMGESVKLNLATVESLKHSLRVAADFVLLHGKDSMTIGELDALKENISSFLGALARIRIALSKLLPDTLLEDSPDRIVQVLKDYAEIFLRVQGLSYNVRKYLNPALWYQISTGHWVILAEKSCAANQLYEELSQIFSKEIISNFKMVDNLTMTLTENSKMRFLKPTWWRARSKLSRFLGQVAVKHTDRLQLLERLRNWQQLTLEVRNDDSLLALVGIIDDPCTIDFESILRAQIIFDELLKATPELWSLLQKEGVSAERLLQQTIEILGHNASVTLLDTAEHIKREYDEDNLDSIKDVAICHEQIINKVLHSIQALGVGSIISKKVLNELPAILDGLKQLVVDDVTLCNRSIKEIRDALSLYNDSQKRTVQGVRTPFIELMVRGDKIESEKIRARILQLGSLLGDFKTTWAAFKDTADLDESELLGQSMMSTQTMVINDRLAILKMEIDQVGDWAKIQKLLVSFRHVDCTVYELVESYIKENRPFAGISQSFIVLLEQNLAREAFIENEFSNESGEDIQALRRRFEREDTNWKEAGAKHVKATVLSQPIWQGSSIGPRRDWTGLELIRNELSKKTRRISQRRLIGRAGISLLSMTPCFMMSPVTVAEFLAPSSGINFDLILIDEASQMRPEEALSAIVRGKQLIVVGDSQQLPPTNFYFGATEDDQVSDEDAIDNESILDMAKATFNSHNLRWHYRSRHDSLIHFSNMNFYQGRLIVCPSPKPISELMGLHLIRVDGTYKDSCNNLEAEQIVAKAVELLQSFPDRSLGIVAINSLQRELISSLLYETRYNNPDINMILDKWEEKGMRCFVKNLENVQGDERDTILISTVYGPAQTGGRVLRNFGPINSTTGHRRLNVLFTRARDSMYVFTSLKPSDVCPQGADASSRGAQVLSKFLEFAGSGILEPSSTKNVNRKDPDSPFEQYVGDLIEQSGYEVEYQVGQSGFRIDLGVKHSSFPYGYLAGIECDGKLYHSSISARDRDRLRQNILEDHGWNIYRIWSTDWFNDPRKEGQKLIKWLDNRRNELICLTDNKSGADVIC